MTREEACIELEKVLLQYLGQKVDDSLAQLERDKLYFLKQWGFENEIPSFDVVWESVQAPKGAVFIKVIVSLWTKEKLYDTLDTLASSDMSRAEGRMLAVSALLGYIGDREISDRFEILNRYFDEKTKKRIKALSVYKIKGNEDRYVVADLASTAISKWQELFSEFSSIEYIAELVASKGEILYKVGYEGWSYYCLASSPIDAIGVVNNCVQNLQNRTVLTVELIAKPGTILR